MPATPLYAQVIIPGGLPEALWYAVPVGVTPLRGTVVVAPLQNKRELGLLASFSDQPPPFVTKMLEIHPSGYCFDTHYIDLLEWVARYYLCPVNRALEVFWPKGISAYLDALGKAPRPRMRKLAPFHSTPIEAPPLTPAQAVAANALLPLVDGAGFRGALVQGITGSGKTRVYLELVQRCLAAGGNALILVPEIGLTPQTIARFQQHLEVEVLPFHSNLSAPVRRHTWMQLLEGKARVVLGTRSAALAPHLNPQLIIIDEEHDSSYKQQDPAPRYHVRELCFHHAHRHGGLVVLGSATPSLESWENARRGHLQLVRLDQRVHGGPPPAIEIIDMRVQRRKQGKLQISVPLREALQTTLEAGDQAIVLHNRRGFATSRVCIDCGTTAECLDCKVPLTFHRERHTLLCHYCDRCYLPETPCRSCGSRRWELLGCGIEKVEEELLHWLPQARLMRMDRDSVSRIGSAEAMLAAFRAREYNLLLGTQMVAKGHDFPGVRLVGVINADTGASLPDFRCSERLFQLITQVAGRAGRVESGGRVLLQTWRPEDPLLLQALAGNHDSFAQQESDLRRDLGYPPWNKILSLECSSPKAEVAREAIQAAATFFRSKTGVQVMGPAEAFVSVVRGQHRFQLMLKSKNSSRLRELAEEYIAGLSRRELSQVKYKWDMDPLDLL